MKPTDAQLRPLIVRKLSADEIRGVCFDYFPSVYDELTPGMTKSQMAELLVGYCRRHDLIPNLRTALHAINPNTFPLVEQTPNPAQPTTPTKRDHRQIFISHAHQDAQVAQRLARDLQGRGWPVWIAPNNIQPGEKWAFAINRGLEECGIFVSLLTPDAIRSRWVNTETYAAISLEHRGLMRFFPLLLRACQPPVLWSAYQIIDLAGSYENGFASLLLSLEPVSAVVTSIPVLSNVPDTTEVEVVKQGVRKKQDLTQPDAYIDPISGKEMLRIPAGKFLYGDNKREVELPEFWISKTPVTNAEYVRFVDVTGHDKPQYFDSNLKNKKDHPMVYVSWHDAQAYCEWMGGELPAEEQWEKAARGPDGLVYPWGDKWVDGRCNTREAGIKSTTSVGQFSPQGDSPYGCVDMSGNVWEWTDSWYENNQISRVLRGGAWGSNQSYARAASRNYISPDYRVNYIGFRVVVVRRSPSQNAH